MAVYKGDDAEEINATNAYNKALQTLAESSVPLAGGGDYAATIRKNWPVGQMKFADGGYARDGYSGKGFVKPVAGAVEEAVAAAKKLMSGEGEASLPARVLNALGLYSHGAEAAANLPQAKGTAEQMVAMLRKQGVKQAELKNAGLIDEKGNIHPDWAGKSVTKDELAQHLTGAVPQVEETVLTMPQGYPFKNVTEWHRLMNKAKEEGDIATAEKLFDQWQQFKKEKTPIFEKYTLPGGENYRELLLKSPLPKEPLTEPEFVVTGAFPDRFATRAEAEAYIANLDKMLESFPELKEKFDRFPAGILEQEKPLPASNNVYKQEHFPDPNVLAHLRMSDRTGPNGEKLLHVEEIQSDWGQQGRKEGFHDPQRPYEVFNTGTGNVLDSFKTLKEAEEFGRNHPDSHSLDWGRAEGPVKGPYVTSTPGWTDLALKRAMKEAAEGGHSGIVFTPGAEQSIRWPTGDEKTAKGLMGYYDTVIPARLQELIKGYGPDVTLGRLQPEGLPEMLHLPITDTMREGITAGQTAFARGGYAGRGFVKPVAGAVEEAIAAAKKLMTREPVPVRAPDPYVKGVNDPKPELQQAIKDYYAGKLTREQYDDVVRRVSPVEPYDFIPQPSPEHLAVDALNAAKKDKYAMNRDIYQEGDPVSLRLDIPAYTNLPNSQWVNSIHDTRGVHPTTYDSVSAARNVDFVVPESKARATGEGGPKAPYAVMRGEYVPITAEEAIAQAQQIMGGPLPSQWQQVGMDPRRHSYFYTRDDRMMPVTNADEVLQIGPVVYAKNPKVGEREDFGYARGGYAEGGDPEIEDALRLAQESSNPMGFVPNTKGPQQPAPADPTVDASGTGKWGRAFSALTGGRNLQNDVANVSSRLRPYEDFSESLMDALEHSAQMREMAAAGMRSGEPHKVGMGAVMVPLAYMDQAFAPVTAGFETLSKTARRFDPRLQAEADVMGLTMMPTPKVEKAYELARDVMTAPAFRLGYNTRGRVKPGALSNAIEALVNSTKESPVKAPEAKVPAIAKQPEAVANPELPPVKTWRHGISLNKLPVPLEEMRATRVDKNELIPRKFTTPADYEGSVGIPIHGDRTIAGEILTHVMDNPTAYGVNLPGGFDYTRGPAQTGPDKSGWASEKSAISKMFNQATAIADKGKTPIGLSAAMGSRSGDYSAHMADALLAQMPGSKILRKDINAFDEAMRQHDPNWIGIENPDIRKYLEQARSVRTRMAEEMFAHQDKNFPNVPITRFAITSPDLLHAPTGSTGYSIMGIEPHRSIITDPAIPHGTGGLRTYSTDLPAVYMGGYKDPLPMNIAWRDWWNNLDPKFQDPSKTSQMLRKFREFDNPTQEFTPEYVDTTMNYLRKTYPDSGYARGGYPEAREGYDPQAEAEALRLARETNPREEHAMFTGSRGARFSPMVEEALRLAERMMNQGMGKKEILKDTGWFLDQQGMPRDYRGATNNPQWKTEINDLDARLKMSPEEFSGKTVKLPDILEHPELFELVPSMEKVTVGPGNLRGAYRGYFDKDKNYIGLRGGMDPDLFLSTLLHEGQHGLQRATGLVGGGDPSRMSQFTDNTMEALNRELALKVANEMRNRGLDFRWSNIDALKPHLIESDPRLAENPGWGRFIDDAYKADPAEHAAQTEAIRAKNLGSETAVDAYKRIVGENEAYNVEERLKQGITKDQMRDIHPEDTALHPFDQTFQQSPQ